MNLYIFNQTRRHGAIYGVGTYIRELTAALKDSEIKVCIVTLASEKPQIQREETSDIQYWYFPAPIQWTESNPEQWKLYYRNIVYLLRLHIKDKKELVFHLNYMECKPLADALKDVFDCKIVLVVHYLRSVMSLLGNISQLRSIISQFNESTDEVEISAKLSFLQEKEILQCQAIDKIICLSNHTFDLLHHEYQIEKEKLVIIHNGLPDSISNTDKQTLRQKYLIPNAPVFLFAGRLDDVKGLKYALRAFRIVLNTQPDCHFMIAGNGAFDLYMKECEGIWMNVTWTGLIDKPILYELYSIADIGMMPSFHEQCSYVAIEMMMHGVSLIASTTTGLKEMIEDGETGLRIPVIEFDDRVEIDTELLAAKMLYLLEHLEEAKRLGRNARKRYEEQYTTERMGKQMIALYKSLWENN